MPFCNHDQCDDTSMLQRLCVDRPEALGEEPWQSHLQTCRICREEFDNFVRSLAVFKCLESERIESGAANPTWEGFLARLYASESQPRRWHQARLFAAAAVSGLLVLGGVISWATLGGGWNGGNAPLAGSRMAPASQNNTAQQTPVTSQPVANRASGDAVDVITNRLAEKIVSAPALRNAQNGITVVVESRGNRARRDRQLPWLDPQRSGTIKLIPQRYMARSLDRGDPSLLAPLTPLRAPAYPRINYASYGGASRR